MKNVALTILCLASSLSLCEEQEKNWGLYYGYFTAHYLNSGNAPLNNNNGLLCAVYKKHTLCKMKNSYYNDSIAYGYSVLTLSDFILNDVDINLNAGLASGYYTEIINSNFSLDEHKESGSNPGVIPVFALRVSHRLAVSSEYNITNGVSFFLNAVNLSFGIEF